MDRRPLLYLGLIPLLAACSPLPAGDGNAISVTSEPSGAEVVVMDEVVGVTPLQLPLTRVFPLTYAKEREDAYGRVRLRKQGCADWQAPVSNRAVAAGLHARLSCEAATVRPVADRDVRGRLERLEALRRDGIISEEEYATQRQRILGEL